MKKMILSLLTLLLLTTGIFANFSLQNLQVNYQSAPIGTDITKPQFSWQMKAMDNRRGYMQTAYLLIATDEKNREVWNSGKIHSGIATGIEYAGKPLQPTTQYTWKITVWDNNHTSSSASASFETGLMNTGTGAWSGAKWIGGGDEDLVLYSHYLSVFKIQYGIQLDETSKSTKASFVFGGNDKRLANKNLNLMAVERKKDESYMALELNIDGVGEDTSKLAKLNIYRVGYTNDDKADVPFKTLNIPNIIINNYNKYQKHSVYADCNFGIFDFYIDQHDDAHKLADPTIVVSRFGSSGINVNPVGAGNNYISFPMLADIGFKTTGNNTAYFSDVQVRNLREPSNILFTENLSGAATKSIFNVDIESGSYRVNGNTLVTADPTKNAAPMLRTVFTTASKQITKARLYVTARGIYEIHLNGKRVSNDYFNPGLTQYNKDHMYQTYDVTSSLKTNQRNALGAWLSEGWWSGNITYSGDNWNYFGDRQSLLAKLVIKYADGSEQVITSNDKDWKLFTDGPIRCGSFFQGEVYDAGKDKLIEGWSTAAYNYNEWKPAVEVPLKGTTYAATTTDFMGRKNSISYDDHKLTGQDGASPTIVKTLTAKSVEEVRPKVFVYDMGQNMVGVPQIQIRNGKKGDIITIRYAEVKYPNLPDYKGNEGMVMMENIRAALAQDLYVLKGGDEIIQPRFTFHGYRYLEITGIDKRIAVADVKGQVISSVNELASYYETSDTLVNKLWQNITWSLRSNFLSIPTDCPNRNERMGWSGDISVFSRSATYLTDANAFLKRHLLAMRDVQSADGRFTDVAPLGGGFGGALWGSAGIVVAWETYRQYGDKQLLAEHYDAMQKYIAFLETRVDKQTGILNEGPLGDWLSPEGNKNDNTLLWMAYFAYDLQIMSKMAVALGNKDDAKKYNDRMLDIKKAWNEIYVDKSTHKTIKSGMRTGFMGAPNEEQGSQKTDKGVVIDTQVSYAVPLALGVFSEENKPYAIQYLREAVQRKNKDDAGVERPEYSLMTGFIGTASMNEALSENGCDDIAYRLLVQKQYPSWLYSVVNGATSIWERLNSYTNENGFGGNNSMNSFNHYSFGAVAAWMYNYSLGIQRNPDDAGFKTIILKPTPDPNKLVTYAKGYYDGMYGRIISEWKIAGNKTIYKITVPANTTAQLYIKAAGAKQLTESGKTVDGWKGIGTQNGYVVIPLVSGNYLFETTL